MVEGKEGARRRGGTPHHHVYTNVGKFSRLFIFVIIKQITFKLGDSTTLNLVPRALFPGFGSGKSALGTRLALSNYKSPDYKLKKTPGRVFQQFKPQQLPRQYVRKQSFRRVYNNDNRLFRLFRLFLWFCSQTTFGQHKDDIAEPY